VLVAEKNLSISRPSPPNGVVITMYIISLC